MTPIVDEITTGPEKSDFFTGFHGKKTGELTERLDEATEKKVDDDFSKQTGLNLGIQLQQHSLETILPVFSESPEGIRGRQQSFGLNTQ